MHGVLIQVSSFIKGFIYLILIISNEASYLKSWLDERVLYNNEPVNILIILDLFCQDKNFLHYMFVSFPKRCLETMPQYLVSMEDTLLQKFSMQMVTSIVFTSVEDWSSHFWIIISSPVYKKPSYIYKQCIYIYLYNFFT